jgi:hypothetical protein
MLKPYLVVARYVAADSPWLPLFHVIWFHSYNVLNLPGPALERSELYLDPKLAAFHC